MRVRRAGKCVECGVKVIQFKDFPENVGLFDEPGQNRIRGRLAFMLKAWRDSPILCDTHLQNQLDL